MKRDVGEERKRDPASTQKPGAHVMSCLTYPYLDGNGSLVGCFEVINPYLNVVSIMNYQTKWGGESFDLFFFVPIMHDVFPQKTLKSISSCLLSCSGQRATLTELTLSCLTQVQRDSGWTWAKASKAKAAPRGLKVCIMLLSSRRVVSPV